MDGRTWPVGDQEWVGRYRAAIAGKSVPEPVLREREDELLAAARAAELPAQQLFGDAGELAADDAADLATEDEAVRASLGGGLRPALREVGGSVTAIGAVATVILFVRGGGEVDVDVALGLIAASVLVLFVGWILARTFVSAGRPASGVAAMVIAGATALAGIAVAVAAGPGRTQGTDVPVVLLAVVMVAPGIAMLVASSRMPQQELRESWADDEWLHRFRGALRARLVPAAASRGHVTEIQQATASGATSAYEEFGHPVALARVVADADRTARSRRWWVSTVAGVAAPSGLALLVLANHSWGAMTFPLAAVLVLVAGTRLVVGWGARPHTDRP